MLIVTTDGIPGCDIRSIFGEVFGVALQVDHGRASGQSSGTSSGTFRVTGEQPVGLAGARREAVERLTEEARRRGANAIVGMRFDSTPLGGGHEVCAYGTAVLAEAAGEASRRPHETHPQPAPAPGHPGATPGGAPPMAARNLTIGLHSERGDRHR